MIKKFISTLFIIVFVIFTIPVGDYVELDGSDPILDNYIKYCGIVNSTVFSIAISSHPHAYVNLYYPIDSDIIRFRRFSIKIRRVTPEELTIEYQK